MALDTQFTFSGVSRTSVLPDKTCDRQGAVSDALCVCLYTSMALETQFTFSGVSKTSVLPDNTCQKQEAVSDELCFCLYTGSISL